MRRRDRMPLVDTPTGMVGTYVAAKVVPTDLWGRLYRVEQRWPNGKTILRDVMVPAGECDGDDGLRDVTALGLVRAFRQVEPVDELEDLEEQLAA
jgi:hypothetical protein